MTFVLRRLLWLAPMLLAVSLVTFVMIHLVPGDPVEILMGQNATGASLQLERHELGLDQPLPVQYVRYLAGVLHGDLGTSIRSRRPVLSEIADRLPATLELALAAMALAIVLGLGTGTLAAAGGRRLSGPVLLLSTLGLSLPTFWLGLLLIELFSLKLGWFPVLGNTSLRGTVLPALTLALPAAAVLAHVTYAGLVEALHQDYIRTARAKGLPRRRVILVHALRNALVVVITILGLQFGSLLAGTVIVESVFSRTGLGTFIVGAILGRDYPDIQGTVLVLAALYVAINLVLDLLYAVLNPRIRLAA
jgi:ABC-type dipeptide/oligopeptide/nickel transport system permease component